MFPRNFDEAVRTGFAPYMEEQIRTDKINAIIRDFKDLYRRGYNPNNYIHEVLSKYGLNEHLLTDAEVERINHCING